VLDALGISDKDAWLQERIEMVKKPEYEPPSPVDILYDKGGYIPFIALRMIGDRIVELTGDEDDRKEVHKKSQLIQILQAHKIDDPERWIRDAVDEAVRISASGRRPQSWAR
jgi:hypothetical protein